MLTLAFDTANTPLSVAVISDQKPLAVIQTNKARNHEATLMPAIDHCLKLAQIKISEIDRLIVTRGPGSYTGVRIAVTTAKILAWTLNKPLYAISSLKALLVPWRCYNSEILLVALMDARRDHFFSGYYFSSEQQIVNKGIEAYRSLGTIISDIEQSTSQHIVVVGHLAIEQQQKMIDALKTKTLEFAKPELSLPLASGFISLVDDADLVTDLDGLLPNYLRQTEAEKVWQQAHPEEINNQYVEQV